MIAGCVVFCLFHAAAMPITIDTDPSTLTIEADTAGAVIRLTGCEPSWTVGAPALPICHRRYALPQDSRVKGVRVVRVVDDTLPQRLAIAWTEPPTILSATTVKRAARDETIYQSDAWYPGEIVHLAGQAELDNQTICELIIHPVQYHPITGRILVHRHVEAVIDYEPGVNVPARHEIVDRFVENAAALIHARDASSPAGYVIVTNPPLDTVFQRLADWKTKKGVPCRVRTVNWIAGAYGGEDLAAQIRNYFVTLLDSGVVYALLGGDTDVIPCRFAFAMACSADIYPGREDTMPADLYYADLQGSWNLDGDGSYGEIEDSIDLYPDLMVGRAPVNTIAEAQRFVNKVLTYEKNPELAYLDNALFAAEILWTYPDPYTDQGLHKNKIGSESFPLNFELTKLYESLGNESPATVKAAIRTGQNPINHDGHGWINIMGVGTGYLYNQDFDTLTNAPRYGILFSIGCWTSAFDFASISEAYVNSPNGGGVAFIGNSSYGWGSPGNPGFGYSDRFDSRFFYSLFKEDNFHLGKALALSKAHFIPYSREKNVYRWHQYQINLLGDPELAVWTQIPETLFVSYPQSIPLNSARILITVRDNQTQAPIKNALVCLMKGTESYASGYTNASGTVFLDVTPATAGNINLTVTAHNYLPKEITIPVLSGSYVNYLGWIINDASANNDGLANPNENILLPTKIKNSGNATANNIQLRLRSADPLVTILDSTAAWASLNPGDSVIIDNAFNIQIGNASNGQGISFDLEIAEDNRTLNFNPVILVGAPLLNIRAVTIPSPPSLPGQAESLYVDIENTGFGFGHATWAGLTSSDPHISILVDSVWYGEIYPESCAIALYPFVVSISSGCPASYLARILLTINSEFAFSDTIQLLIGETGFSDDLETGSGLWTTDGTNNLWHISTRRSFSPTHSWYCGQESNGKYLNGMNCYIQTVPFMVQANSELAFHRWFSVPLYGTDGIYVIIMRDSIADTLDFIGTGGALGGRGINSDWMQVVYPLTTYAPGDTIVVRFAFVSDDDGDVSEGFYIDDVRITGATAVTENGDGAAPQTLLLAAPNPFRSSVRLDCALNSSPMLDARLIVYDVLGRQVKDLSSGLSRSENSSILYWDGTDDAGKDAGNGLFFIRLECATGGATAKVIRAR